ncbi:TAXI family TRAP transporter solute-binding subunit [Natronobeatus ordinarius]|uniref:TAXI family TRAP transporter solute-binding subunit n=1 Tax=Natronobeatus ordinarius TaxID=2963433 RepID=UPI0020CF626D|nr:TAXI family TRAP transporter solute-binding subunit [Natronobeatus ordinarius]
MTGSSRYGYDRRTFLKATSVSAAGGLAAMAGCLGSDDQFVTIGTGGTGGVYYILGGGIADLLNEELEGINASAESTGASVENAREVGGGEMTMALALSNSVLLAVDGEGDFDEPEPLQAMFGAYVNHTQVVVPEDSEVETLDDLEGLDVSVGSPGSGTEVIAQELLEWYGLSYDDINEERLSFAETADALIDGQIDAGFWSVGPPTSSIEEVTSQRDIRLLSFPEDDLAAIDDEFPYYTAATIEPDTYPDQDYEVHNPGVVNTMIVNEDADEDLVYDITEAIYENLDDLATIHDVVGEFEGTARGSPIDLHPGSEAYLDDVGL